MEYVTVSRMAQKWGISDRSVRNYCEKGRIPGAKLIGKLWYLPEDSCKPERINKRSKPSTELTVSIKMDWLTSIKEIQKAQENNQLVIFVGAGVSKNSNVPTWWELIKKFADKIGYDRCIDCNFKSDDCPKEKCSLRFDFSQDEFLRIPEYYYQQDTSENHASYMSLIQSTLRGGTGPNPIDDVIFNLLPHHIITTNYDSLLEDSQNVNSQLYTVVCQDSDLLSKSNERYILKMHGDLELPETIVLKESDYLDYEQKHPLISTFIRSLLVNHTFLFLGYSLNDYNLNLIIGWINYFRKYHGVEQRPCNFLIDSKAPSVYEQSRLKDKSIYIIDLSSLPSDLENSIEIPEALTNSVGRKLYSYLHCISNPTVFHKYVPLETRLIDKYQQLNSYNKIAYRDLINIHPLGRTELIASTLIFYDQEWYDQVSRIIEDESPIIVEVFRRAGISEIQYYSNNFAITVPGVTESIASALQLYLDNDYVQLQGSIHNSTDIAEQIYNYYLLGSDRTLINEMLARDAIEASQKDYIAILLHKMRNRLATLSLSNRQEVKTSELSQLFETCPIKYRKAITHLKMLHETSAKDMQQMADLLEEQEKRYDYHSNTWYSNSAFINIWKLRAYAYDYYFFSKENFIPLDYFSDPKKYYSYYLKSILCSYSPTKEENKNDAFGLETDLRPYPIEEIDFDMFVKFVSPKTLNAWIKKYSVQKVILDPNIDILNKFSNLLRSFAELKIRYWEDYILNFSTIACLADLSDDKKIALIDSASRTMEHIATSAPYLAEHFFDAITHLTFHLGLNNALDSKKRLLNSILNPNIYPVLIEHKNYAFKRVTKKLSSNISHSTQQNLLREINNSEDNREKVAKIYSLRFVLSKDFCSSYFTEQSTQLRTDELFSLLVEKYLPYCDAYWNRFLARIKKEDELRKSKPGYRAFPDALMETINHCILLSLVGFNVKLSDLSPFAHYSDHLQFMLTPNEFDYSTVDTSNYMWQNLIYSQKYQQYFINHKDQIISEALREVFSRGVDTVGQRKILYGILLNTDEIQRF